MAESDPVQTENEYSGFQAPFNEDLTYESELKAVLVTTYFYRIMRPFDVVGSVRLELPSR
jgi:hypothetical protein